MVKCFFGLLKLSVVISVFSPVSVWAVEATTNLAAVVEGGAANVWLTFGLDRLSWLQGRMMGNPLWQYLAAILYVVLAFYASKCVDYLVQAKLRKLVAKTKTDIDDFNLDLAHGPVKVITLVVLLHIGLRVFSWPQWAETFISNGLKIIVAGSITYLLLRLVDVGMQAWQHRVLAAGEAVLDMHLFPVIRKTAKGFVLVVAVLVTMQNLGMNVTGLLASLSIGGLAVGLAAQDTLSNLFGAVALFVDKPFRIGDRIQFDAIDGEVEGIGMRSTRIRNQDGHLVVVPNRTMANASLTNVSKRPSIKTMMNIGLTYDTSVEQVQRATAISEKIFRAHPRTADLIVSFNKFENSSLNIQIVHWFNSADNKEYLQAMQAFNLELKRQFDAEGIQFAFPTQTVYVKPDAVSIS
jgi:MscS family membrane protein